MKITNQASSSIPARACFTVTAVAAAAMAFALPSSITGCGSRRLQRDASVNTLFVATFTYGRGIAGRQVPGQPLPDHGKQQYDTDKFKGGSYTKVRPQYYKDTPLREF